MPSVPLRTYEEIEKRRNVLMGGERERSAVDDVLLLIFLASVGAALFSLVAPWTGLFPSDYTLAEAATAVAAVSLFGHRFRAFGRRHSSAGAFAFALTDVLAFLAVLGLAAWTLVFPLLRPLPGETVVLGVFSLILISAMAVVLRVIQPNFRSRPDRAYTEIESTIRQLEEAVTQLSSRLPQRESKIDPAMTERLSKMMTELEAMRKDFASLRASAPPLGSWTQAPAYGVSGVRTSPEYGSKTPGHERVVTPREQVAAVKPQSGARWSADTGVSVPESTVNNPWLDVLSSRRTKKAQGSPGGPESA